VDGNEVEAGDVDDPDVGEGFEEDLLEIMIHILASVVASEVVAVKGRGKMINMKKGLMAEVQRVHEIQTVVQVSNKKNILMILMKMSQNMQFMQPHQLPQNHLKTHVEEKDRGGSLKVLQQKMVYK